MNAHDVTDLPIAERLALQGIRTKPTPYGTCRQYTRTLVDAASGEPIAIMDASEACEFLAFLEAGR